MSDLIERLVELRKRFCTGPCAQSCSVLAAREKDNAVFSDAIEFLGLIHELREGEGDVLTIFSTNSEPDEDGEDCESIGVTACWTDWVETRFDGATQVDALRKAIIYKSEKLTP